MVAITVILAAVIGTFVLGLGDSLNQTPQATLNAEDTNNPAAVANDSASNLLAINHGGGDQISAGEYNIRVQGAGSSSYNTIFKGGSNNNATVDLGNGDLEIGIADGANPEDIGVGNRVVIAASDASPDGTTHNEVEGDWGVQIIHVPSDSIILDRTITIQ